MPTPKTPFDVAGARRLYEQGTSIRKLAERFHVKQARMVAELRQAGAVIRRRGSQPGRSILLTFEQIAEARRLYVEGNGSPAIAERFGVSYQTVLLALQSTGVLIRRQGTTETRPPGRTTAATSKRARRAAAELGEVLVIDARKGHGLADIARRWHIRVDVARAALHLLGARCVPGLTAHLEPQHRARAKLRHLPPLRVPIRSKAERRLRAFTQPERVAVQREIAQGRVLVAPRGWRGISSKEDSPWRRSTPPTTHLGLAA